MSSVVAEAGEQMADGQLRSVGVIRTEKQRRYFEFYEGRDEEMEDSGRREDIKDDDRDNHEDDVLDQAFEEFVARIEAETQQYEETSALVGKALLFASPPRNGSFIPQRSLFVHQGSAHSPTTTESVSPEAPSLDANSSKTQCVSNISNPDFPPFSEEDSMPCSKRFTGIALGNGDNVPSAVESQSALGNCDSPPLKPHPSSIDLPRPEAEENHSMHNICSCVIL